jgi:hypothetical protein
MSSQSQFYTATQIARAAGISRQAVSRDLSSKRPGEAWEFSALPLEWQLEITRRGVKRGFSNGEEFLNKLPEPWICPLPWNKLPGKQQTKAVKLQKALARALGLRDDTNTTAAKAESAGLEDFKAQFGFEISARHWHRLFNRTIERDAGADEWQRRRAARAGNLTIEN